MLFRQTNIIWVAFVAAQSIGPFFIHTIHCAQIEQTNQQTPAKFSLTTTGQTWEVGKLWSIVKCSNGGLIAKYVSPTTVQLLIFMHILITFKDRRRSLSDYSR